MAAPTSICEGGPRPGRPLQQRRNLERCGGGGGAAVAGTTSRRPGGRAFSRNEKMGAFESTCSRRRRSSFGRRWHSLPALGGPTLTPTPAEIFVLCLDTQVRAKHRGSAGATLTSVVGSAMSLQIPTQAPRNPPQPLASTLYKDRQSVWVNKRPPCNTPL